MAETTTTTTTIHPARLTDLAELTRIELATMLATSAIARLLYPDGITDVLVAEETAAMEKHFGDVEHVTYVKAVVGDGRGDGGKIAGFLRYYTWADDEAARSHPPYSLRPSTSRAPSVDGADGSVVPADEDGVPAPEVVATVASHGGDDEGRGQRAEKLAEYRSVVHFGIRQRWTEGKKAVYVSMLMVLPEYHGRGYGRLLIAHAMRTASKLKLPVYLFSMPATVGFYQHMGFKVLETGQINLADFGGRREDGTDEVHLATFMGCESVGDEFGE